MRTIMLAIVGACALLAVGQAIGQDGLAGDVRQPASAQSTAFGYDNYLYFAPQNGQGGASPSPSDQPSTAVPPAAKPQSQPEAKTEEANTECPEDKPWQLPQPCFLKCRDITLGGWTEIGATMNNWDPVPDYNGLVTFADKSGQALLGQQWLFLDKPIKNDGCGWAWGGHIDVVYGSDALFTQAVGLETAWDQTAYYQLALPQFYFDVAYNDLTIRVGHFFTILGYEVVQAPQNFFYTHAYTHQYGEPFTHTGALAMYKVNDQFSFSVGVHRGDDQFGPSYSPAGVEVDHFGFLGGVKWVGPQKKLELTWGLSTSEKNQLEASQWISSFFATYHVTDNFKYVFQSDYGQVANSYVVGGPHADWYGINQYLIYQINKCWAAGLRAEWFADPDGVRVTGLRPQNPIYGQYFAGNFYEISAGLNWKPNLNLTVRPELRYDWYDPAAGQEVFPFDNGTHSHQWLVGVDAILTY